MNYLLFINPQSGSKILKNLVKSKLSPTIIVTFCKDIDNWKRIFYRWLRGKETVEDRCRYINKIAFYDYFSINTDRLKKIIKEKNIQIGFITTFSKIIPVYIIDLFPRGVYNLHPSLLPKHGGANPFFWIIYNGDTFTGTTCHKATDKLDSGEIYYQTKHKIKDYDSEKLFDIYVKDCIKIISEFKNNFVELIKNPVEQNSVEYDPKNIPSQYELLKICKNSIDRKKINRALKFYNKSI